MSTDPGGVLLVDKSKGPTSHDIVEHVRRLGPFNDRKVGHAGTLDPFATGLLLILVGSATRIQQRLMDLDKTYLASAQFGARSDTGDPYGQIKSCAAKTDPGEIRTALPSFLGEIEQQVPATSAVKVGGERLYRKAHRGEAVETPRRAVRVERLELIEFDRKKQIAHLRVACGKGTYIRQLIGDIGEKIETGAYCRALRRISIGPFNVDRAATLEQLGEFSDTRASGAWRPLTYLVGDITL